MCKNIKKNNGFLIILKLEDLIVRMESDQQID